MAELMVPTFVMRWHSVGGCPLALIIQLVEMGGEAKGQRVSDFLEGPNPRFTCFDDEKMRA
jgi:hypothetical protein